MKRARRAGGDGAAGGGARGQGQDRAGQGRAEVESRMAAAALGKEETGQLKRGRRGPEGGQRRWCSL